MSETFSTEVVVIGAGVVGLAIAKSLAEQGREVIVIEQHKAFGVETSSRNSEVIHAGIYYPQNSQKAKFCVKGKALLYEYCELKKIPYKKTGKLIVATNDKQMDTLSEIQNKAKNNGVYDLQPLNQNETLAREPALSALGALFSPSTGIIDSHHLMLNLLGDLESAGGYIAYNSRVTQITPSSQRTHIVRVENIEAEHSEISAELIINSAGLHAIGVAEAIQGFPRTHIPKARFAKGSYFSYSAHCPFSHLIYPVPEVGGLGIHLTLDLSGNARFGPDVTWIDDIDYQVDPHSIEKFSSAISNYFPTLNKAKLQPDYAGVRPKIVYGESIHQDFVISTEHDHNIPGIVNLFGVESPGLTSCLAIADYIAGDGI